MERIADVWCLIVAATIVNLMVLMIPSHVTVNWDDVCNRTLNTSVGCLMAILVGLLFGTRRGFDRLSRLGGDLRNGYVAQLERQRDWLDGRGERSLPVPPANLSHDLVAMEALVAQERRGHNGRRVKGLRWVQRLQLWAAVQHTGCSGSDGWLPFPTVSAQIRGPLPWQALMASLRTLGPVAQC